MKMGTSHAPEVLCDLLKCELGPCLRSKRREILPDMLCLVLYGLP